MSSAAVRFLGTLVGLFGAVSIAAAQTSRAAAAERGEGFDLVIANGRVIDPETGLDGVRSVGIRGGRIAAISSTPLRGRTVLDATGLVVAPGFIDLHSHGQELPGARMQAFDGVTTSLELEAGILPVATAYERVAREGRPINYGFSASWLYARVAEKEGMEPTGSVTFFQEAQTRKGWQYTVASAGETERIIARLQRGLDEGALGIGVLAGYAPGYGRKEAFAVAQLAARAGVPAFTHVRYMSVIEPQSSFEAIEEVVALAAGTGARMHICHLNSSSIRDIPRASGSCCAARKRVVSASPPRRTRTAADPRPSAPSSSAATGASGSEARRPATSSSPELRSPTPPSPTRRRRRPGRGWSCISSAPIAAPRIRTISTSPSYSPTA